MTVGVLLWIHKFKNRRVVLFCDNDSVCRMLNKTSTGCKNCMVLIRLIVLESLVHNVRVFARWIEGKKNIYADGFSRLKIRDTLKKAKGKFNKLPTAIPEQLWPMSKIWLY